MAHPDPAPVIENLAWMEGHWKAQIRGGEFEETWSLPKAGSMTGMGRETKDEKTRFIELMTIEQTDGGLTMWIILGAPSKGDKKPFWFKLVSMGTARAEWTHPGHDFPERIVYQVAGKGLMTATLYGTAKGEKVEEVYAFRRVS